MAIPHLTTQEQAEIAGLVAMYISSQRQTCRPQGIPLSDVRMAAMNGFFRPLDGAYSARSELADIIDFSVLVELPEEVRLKEFEIRGNS